MKNKKNAVIINYENKKFEIGVKSMDKILPTNGSCPYCGKKFHDYNASSTDFGSPIRKCRYCQKEYLDRRYHEIAVEGWNESSLNISRSLKVIAIGLVIFLVAGGLTAYTIYFKNYYMTKGVLSAFCGALIVIVGIVDAVRIKTGAKQKSLELKRAESEKRLSNPVYAHQLSELCYKIPEKYL